MADSVPATMTAIEIAAPGGPEALRPVQRPVPIPGSGEVLIAAFAAGVNRPDVLQRLGRYDPPAGTTDIPGLELAGRIVAVGPDVSDWAVGDRVCALVTGGGYAEYCVAPAVQCLPIPAGVTPIEAAGLPETSFTVWTNLIERGGLKTGESVLIHGGASGIGTTAIQIAKARGATVFCTVGSDAKAVACRDLGATLAINYRTQDFVEAIRAATDGRGIDVVLDMVGGDYVAKNLKLLAEDGRHVSIAFLEGARVTLDLFSVMRKRLTVTGSTLRARAVAEKGRLARAVQAQAWPLVETGQLKVLVHKTFPLAQAAEAHALMESSAHIGKIILTCHAAEG